ncbi:hypothetical protein [Thalassobaculum litoreum]|uniref:Metal-dependent hydrolase, beta-lactamase superfamily II n=1 Tax=Thalassobaculum litoreum DSM 18839 TaxID=1123362 RepID=A0A8G2EZE8_9PROT|nr:hypothetical protein [Thalassobaculum litoreum]SDG21878.1 hypothetical protein SAMN05660686_03718 [Thalassobaculum litoreum DSM 18839]
MQIEIEFLPVGSGAKSGDAIVLRYWDATVDRWRVMVVDGGYEVSGHDICEHIRRWYNTDFIDFVVGTHPDGDHLSGLKVVLSEMRVGELWLHVPEYHTPEIIHLFKSRRWLPENLQLALRQAFPNVTQLIELAVAQGTKLNAPFQGRQIGLFTVMSPTRSMYDGLLPQFRATPTPDRELLATLGHWLKGIGKRVATATEMLVPEDWHTETLKDGGTTSAENESSVVLYGRVGTRGGVLLTADAGLKALEAVARYSNENGLAVGDDLWLFQIPHHGSRNNVSPQALNYFIGPPVSEGTEREIKCIVSSAPDDLKHPRQVVVNALLRRGVAPTTTKEGALRYRNNMPARDGWGAVSPLTFKRNVEAYD